MTRGVVGLVLLPVTRKGSGPGPVAPYQRSFGNNLIQFAQSADLAFNRVYRFWVTHWAFVVLQTPSSRRSRRRGLTIPLMTDHRFRRTNRQSKTSLGEGRGWCFVENPPRRRRGQE